jgi:tetratricopeptide (TPR) repeat protein
LIINIIPASAQKERKLLRNGNRNYARDVFDESELSYRKALDIDPAYFDAEFNLGDVLYRQEKYEEATNKFNKLSLSELEKDKRAESFFNLGNSQLKAEKLEESIEAYKNSLRIDPNNLEAKHNLAYVQDLFQEQQQQQQQQDNQDQNQDKDKDQQQNNEENNSQDQQEENEQEQEQNEQQMSREDAERLLQALAADENEVQEKVKKAKAARQKVRTLKEW